MEKKKSKAPETSQKPHMGVDLAAGKDRTLCTLYGPGIPAGKFYDIETMTGRSSRPPCHIQWPYSVAREIARGEAQVFFPTLEIDYAEIERRLLALLTEAEVKGLLTPSKKEK